MILAKVFWKQLKKLWVKAKQGGAILAHPKEYFTRSFLPSFASWLCKLGVIAVMLAAFTIPVTFESVMWATGSGSLANVVSVTPGAVGITQATNALALDTCCDVARDTAVDYSTAQQLITTAWNVLLALVLVVSVFGWKGGKQPRHPVVRGREGRTAASVAHRRLRARRRHHGRKLLRPRARRGLRVRGAHLLHGGIGGLQTRPFILHPEHLEVPPGPILGAPSVHGILAGWRLAHQLQGESGAAVGALTESTEPAELPVGV